MKIRVKYVYSDFLKKEELNSIIERLSSLLIDREIEMIEDSNGSFEALVIITGGTEQDAIDLIMESRNDHALILSHNGNNSLAASLEISAYLTVNGKSANLVNLEDEDIEQQLNKYLSYKLPLAGKRAGVIGKPSDWLIASSHSDDIVETSWGLKLVSIPLKELSALIFKHKADATLPPVKKVIEPSEEDLINSQAVYLALKELIAKYNLDALTIRCFDIVVSSKITACYALAKLNAEGFPAGCEGDIPSITGMLWIKILTGKIPWMANPSSIDRKTSRLILAHCTAPLNYLENIVMRSHFETGLAVGIEGDLKFSEVTILRLGGKYLNDLWISKGQVTRTLRRDNLCRTQIEVHLPQDKLDSMLSHPLGNHLLIIPGNYIEILTSSGVRKVY